MLLKQDIHEAISIASVHSYLILMATESANRSIDDLTVTRVNLNQQLSAKLMEFPHNARAGILTSLLPDLLKNHADELLELDGLEILFDRSLAVDPIRLLISCAKKQNIIAIWPGARHSNSLSYAPPSHPEHKSYKASDLNNVIYID